jgi:transposase
MNVAADFKATIGLDWADQKHDLWIHPADGGKPEHTRLEQSPEALHAWVAELRARFGKGRVAVGIETSRGPVISALLAYDFIVIFPVNPKALKDYRAAFCVSGAKNDRSDAQLLEEYVRLHGGKLKALQPDDELTRKLGGLAEARRQLVDERTRAINQVHARLKMYYPLAEKLVGGQLNTLMAADFLARWPDLKSLQAERVENIRRFFYGHNSRSQKKLEARLQAIKTAQPLTSDAALVEPSRALVAALAGVLKSLHKAIQQLEEAIQKAMEAHPDAAIFLSLPGAGPALAPRLLAAFGSRRERFENAAAVAQLYGIAPVVRQSGNTELIRMRHRCPKFGRQTFHENAVCAVKAQGWARRYYDAHRQRHDGQHHQACRALAYKLIRIYFACWKNKTPYEPEKYERALQKNGSPIGAALANTACE